MAAAAGEAAAAKAHHEQQTDAHQQIAQIVEEKGMLYEQIEALEDDVKRLRKGRPYVFVTRSDVDGLTVSCRP